MNYELLRKAVKLCRLLPAGGSAVGMPQQCETDIPNVREWNDPFSTHCLVDS